MATDRKLPEVGDEIHLPGLSAQPLVVAIGVTLMLVGLTTHWVIFAIGAVAFVLSVGAWIRDAREEYRHLPEHEH